ncbi:MAG: ABC transporter permease [Acidobacteria bacterium]|nr:ABC transporter permease [Acidobacteriota bacterium]
MPEWEPEIRRRLANLKLEPPREAAIIEELAQFLEDCYAELRSSGATEAEAYQQTLAELSGSELLALELRRVERQAAPEPVVLGTNRRTNMIADFWQDLRFGVRMLMKNPGFALIAVFTLALGIGATTVMFSLVNAVQFRPLPYREAEQLVAVFEDNRAALCAGCRVGASYPMFLDWRQQAHSFERLGAYREEEFVVTGEREPQVVNGARVSHELFSALGAQPLLGRGLVAEDERAGAAPVVLLSQTLWTTRYGADPKLLGQTIRLNNLNHVVIGVLPARAGFPQFARLWVPLAPAAQGMKREERALGVTGRLRPGVTLEQANAELALLARNQARAYPATNAGWSAQALDLREALSDAPPSLFWLPLGAVWFVLLIVCANLAGLQLARALGRRYELGVRLALGASRWRLIRQMLVESLLLTGLGGMLGLLSAYWLVSFAARRVAPDAPSWWDFSVDHRVLLFCALTSVFTGVLFGIGPALKSSQVDPLAALRDGSAATGGLRQNRLRALLVVSELALTLALLSGAGLMLRTYLRASQPELDYDLQRLIIADLGLRAPEYAAPSQLSRVVAELTERLSLQGSAVAAYGTRFIRGFGAEPNKIAAEGVADVPAGVAPMSFHAVTPAYFSTLGIPLIRGRAFTTQDTAAAPKVAIINRALAALWPGGDAIGKQIKLDPRDSAQPWLTIVGVVGPRVTERPQSSEVYVPFEQAPLRPLTLVIRATAEPEPLLGLIRSELRAALPDEPADRIRTMEQDLAQTAWPLRLYALVFAGFAAFGVLLAAVGVYGIVAYSVTQRTKEIGIRVALGAQARDVVLLVMGEGIKLTLLGIALGLAGALALTRVMSSLLFGLSATDPLTFTVVVSLLAGVSLLACWIPARRAAKVEPLIALRSE